MRKYNATIVIDSNTRENLRRIGKKSQTYDEIIRELIGQKRKDDSQSSGQLRESRKI
jgi:predicted CopG family antitoxin